MDLLDRLGDLPECVVLLARAEGLEDHGLGALVLVGQVDVAVAVLHVVGAVVSVKEQVVVFFLRADILIKIFLVEVHVAVGAQETVLCLVVVAVVVVTAISISIAIQAITVFIISMMVILLVIVVINQQLLLITIGPIVDICIFIFDQFLIGYVPMLAGILVELLVLVGLV